MIPAQFKRLIKRYKEGFPVGDDMPKQSGRRIKANDIPDYGVFADFYAKRVRPNTVRQYLSFLHMWYLPIDKKNLTDFDTSIEMIDDWRHDYHMLHAIRTTKHGSVIRYNGWTPAYVMKVGDVKIDSTKRLTYMMHVVMRKYLQVKDKTLLQYLPNLKSIPNIKSNIAVGHLTEGELNKFLTESIGEFKQDGYPDNQYFLFSLIMFYSGARVSELLHCKKHKDWFPTYVRGQKIKLKKGELFKIQIPRSFAKAKHAEQVLYLKESKHIGAVLDYVNKLKDNQYLFSFSDTNRTKNYIDIQKEKNKFQLFVDDTLQACGLSHKIGEITTHAFRRSYIHYMDEKSGHDIEFTRAGARHSSIDMTGRYLKSKARKFEEKLKELK